MVKKRTPISDKFPRTFFQEKGRQGGFLSTGARLGGLARAQRLTAKRRREIAAMGGRAAKKKRREKECLT